MLFKLPVRGALGWIGSVSRRLAITDPEKD